MSDLPSSHDGPPPVDMVVFSEPAWLGDRVSLPEAARRALFRDGVPRRFLGDSYRADSYLELLRTGAGDEILRFGTTGIDDAIGVSAATGAVVEVPADLPASAALFVNSDVERFTRVIVALLDRYPYYRADVEDDQLAAVAEELREIVGGLDPQAGAAGTYWDTFADDVEIGDYSVELLEDRPDRGVRR